MAIAKTRQATKQLAILCDESWESNSRSRTFWGVHVRGGGAPLFYRMESMSISLGGSKEPGLFKACVDGTKHHRRNRARSGTVM